MTTKHQPATALPWLVDGRVVITESNSKRDLGWIGDFDGGIDHKIDSKNALFAVHAANAYPRLIARVKELSPNDPLLKELGE